MGVLRLSQAGILGGGKRTNFLAGGRTLFDFGYIGGGIGSTVVNKFDFYTDIRTILATGLNEQKSAGWGYANSKVAGYFGHGSGPISVVNTVNKFTFPADTRSVFSTSAAARVFIAGMSNSGVAGYFGGGEAANGTRVGAVTKMLFSNDTDSSLAAALTVATTNIAAMSNSGTAGYFGGGEVSTVNSMVATVRKFAFSDDSATTLATGLSTARGNHAAMSNSGVAGYFGGGLNTGGGTRLSSVEKFAFPSDTRSVLGTGLSTGRNDLAATSATGISGYFAGGDAGAGVITVDKFAFSSDTRTTLGTELSDTKVRPMGMSNQGAL